MCPEKFPFCARYVNKLCPARHEIAEEVKKHFASWSATSQVEDDDAVVFYGSSKEAANIVFGFVGGLLAARGLETDDSYSHETK